MLQSTGSQRAGRDLVIEQQQEKSRWEGMYYISLLGLLQQSAGIPVSSGFTLFLFAGTAFFIN